MATFNAEVKSRKANGTYKVYIRCTHNRENKYIPTDMYIHESKVGKKKEIKDVTVGSKCSVMILEYMRKLNLEKDIQNWSCSDVIDFLTTDNKNIPFSPFCNQYITGMIKDGRKKAAGNYENALKSFENFFGKDVSFQEITSKKIREWIKTLSGTKRAKEMYPTLIKNMFNKGTDEYNDYDNNRIKIQNRPFKGVEIPKSDPTEKRAVEVDVLKKLFAVTPNTKRSEMAMDISKLIIYLAGINTVDLYTLTKDKVKDGKLCYERWKERTVRSDFAYIEVKISKEIEYIFEKYKGEDNRLFSWGYCDADTFNRNYRKGLIHLCKLAGIEKMTSYTFRHTWATIAQNDCKAATGVVAFCLNHASEHKVTEIYIKKKFDIIDEMVRKVADFIFGKKNEGEKPKKRGRKKINKDEVILMNE